jgi:hypothetical protein
MTLRSEVKWKRLHSRYYNADRPHKMLALDGGGIRGMIALQVLRRIEEIVGTRLCDYFDYIGGTSTGAIIAAGLAHGMSVDELTKFYRSVGPLMFEKRWLLERWKSFYDADPLVKQLQTVFGADTTLEPGELGDEEKGKHLESLLLVVTRNATTDSPWPVSSNPDAKYCAPDRKDCNLRVKLWQLVRASTAAPVFFPPEIIRWDKDDPTKTFVFVDGGTTVYNNPAFLLYRMATIAPYNLNWRKGERNLLLISIGTGSAPGGSQTELSPEMNIGSGLKSLALAVMYSAQVDQDINCRMVGRCVFGAPIDREIGDLIPTEPLTTDLGRAFLYARYDADLSAAALKEIGCGDIDAVAVRELDAVDRLDDLERIGKAVAAQVKREHFGTFLGA